MASSTTLSSRRGIDELLQRGQQFGMNLDLIPAARAFASDVHKIVRLRTAAQLVAPARDGIECKACRTRDDRKTAAPDRFGLCARPQPRHALIHRALERVELRADERFGRHVYDLAENEAWVSVGLSHDTGEFAVQTIRTWWKEMGAPRYPDASSLLITADGGGINGYRLRLWKLELQGLVDELGFPITVCHLPPGTSKWNKIEHRLFSSSPRTGVASRSSPITSS